MNASEARELMAYLLPAEREELEAIIAADLDAMIWRPLPGGPQEMAYNSRADVIGYGGAAGGGKTDLAVGKALNQHHEVLIMRREATQLHGVLGRLEELLGGRNGYNGQEKIWRNAGPRGVKLEFGSVPNLGDERKYQGRPHDLLVFDEAANFLEQQVTFLLGWNRTTRTDVKAQALLTFNPPTSAEGRWVIDFFAPWLDRKHPLYPTAPGEIRYAVSLPGENGTSRHVWVDDASPCVILNGELVFDFDPKGFKPEDIIIPQGRTFIPSRISDNPFLTGTGYLRQLQAMPEPLRSQMLYGDFQAGMTDDPWQVIPTSWVEAAMERWRERSPKGEMLALGCDVARGGKDNTLIFTRHRTPEHPWHFARPQVYPGKETPDGHFTSGLVLATVRDQAPIHYDVIGVGASPYDITSNTYPATYGINVAEKSFKTDQSGRLSFSNLRSEYWWTLRELLDPANDTGIELPPDPQLLKDLCAPMWSLKGFTICVESREDIIKRIGRSPDWASGLILAAIDTPKRRDLERRSRDREAVLNYDPIANMNRRSY